jgi:endonuclease/exonuclease/phosphatase family metal-dependent hydrolase
VRVVTWNLWWRFGPWQARRKAILSVLRELRPDVVGLQEVWADTDENLAEWLAAELGLHWTWAATDTPGGWQRRLGAEGAGVDYGNAVLSRWPITAREVLRLPAPPDLDDGRLALYARLTRPDCEVPFFTAHLTSTLDGSAVRRQQVTALVEFVAAHRGGTEHPAVVTGDFNAVPDSDEIRLLGGYRTPPAVPGEVLFDAWEFMPDPYKAPPTWDALANPHAAALRLPSARVDHVFVGPSGRDGLGRVRGVRRAGDEAVEGVWGSDHAAVVVDLRAPKFNVRP